MSDSPQPAAESADLFDYPLMLNLSARLVVVVGAGVVGRRKLEQLLLVGARVRLIDPMLAGCPHPSSLVESIGREFEPADLRDAELIFACTDSPSVNGRVVAEAKHRKQLCCRVDQPLDGTFALPAVLRRGKLTVAVSTGGGSPVLAARLRDRLAEQVPDSWGAALEIVAAVRRKWLTEQIDDKYNQWVLHSFWIDRLLPLVEQGKQSKIDKLLIETFGDDYSLDQLQLDFPEGTS